MKRLCVVIILGLFSILDMWGQEVYKHVVQRGETLESIAGYYRFSPEEIIKANPDMDVFYTGMEVIIPAKMPVAVPSDTDQSLTTDRGLSDAYVAYLADCETADVLFEAREYSKAQKQYRKVIEKYEGVVPCGDALYGNALCSYNREKWKTAIEDLSLVINSEDCSNGQRKHCLDLLSKAYAYREQQLENRSNFWGGVVLTAAAIGTSIAVAASQSKQSASSVSSGSSASSVSSDTTSDTSDLGEGSSSSSSSSSSSTCPSLKVNGGKWYCANTGDCGMCGGDGFMDGQFGQGPNSHQCTLCGGSGKCKYCR